MQTSEQHQPIELAVTAAGGQENVARACGVHQSRVSQWIRGAPIHVRHWPKIVEVADGQLTMEQLVSSEILKAQRQRERVA